MGPAGMGAGQRRGVSVAMDPGDLTVDPGGQVTTTVTLRNLGTRVEEFELLVQGPGAVFASVMPATVSVYPDLEQRAVVRFAPPRGPQSEAGVTTFEVVGRSVVHSDVADVARGRLTITAFQDLQAVLVPETSRGRKPGRHQVKLTNGGNTPMSSEVVFKDQAPLTFEPQRSTAALPPGATVELPVLVKGARRWFGRPELTAFSATVTPAGAQPPIMLQGTRTQNAVFPWWVPLAAAAALLLGIMLPLLWPRTTPTVPVIAQIDQAAAVKTLKDAGYQPDVVQKGDNTVPAGLAIGTDPAGGSPLKSGEHVKLNMSSGPCPNGPCPVEVPDVVGLPVSEAQARLEAKQFTVKIDRVPNDEREVDRVISSDPPANTPRPVPSDVKLTVSTGPKQQNQPPGGPGGGVVPVPLPGGNGGASPAPVASPSPAPAASPSPAPAASPSPAPVASPSPAVSPSPAPSSTPVDLIATADKAKWINGSKATLKVGTCGDQENGKDSGFVRTCVDLGNKNLSYLETNPQKTGSITGTYTLTAPIAAGDHLLARVGLLSGSGTATGPVTFLVEDSKGGKLMEPLPVSGKNLQPLDVDLSSAAGAKSIVITVTTKPSNSATPSPAPASGSATTQSPIWQGLRIESKGK